MQGLHCQFSGANILLVCLRAPNRVQLINGLCTQSDLDLLTLLTAMVDLQAVVKLFHSTHLLIEEYLVFRDFLWLSLVHSLQMATIDEPSLASSICQIYL